MEVPPALFSAVNFNSLECLMIGFTTELYSRFRAAWKRTRITPEESGPSLQGPISEEASSQWSGSTGSATEDRSELGKVGVGREVTTAIGPLGARGMQEI